MSQEEKTKKTPVSVEKNTESTSKASENHPSQNGSPSPPALLKAPSALSRTSRWKPMTFPMPGSPENNDLSPISPVSAEKPREANVSVSLILSPPQQQSSKRPLSPAKSPATSPETPPTKKQSIQLPTSSAVELPGGGGGNAGRPLGQGRFRASPAQPTPPPPAVLDRAQILNNTTRESPPSEIRRDEGNGDNDAGDDEEREPVRGQSMEPTFTLAAPHSNADDLAPARPARPAPNPIPTASEPDSRLPPAQSSATADPQEASDTATRQPVTPVPRMAQSTSSPSRDRDTGGAMQMNYAEWQTRADEQLLASDKLRKQLSVLQLRVSTLLIQSALLPDPTFEGEVARLKAQYSAAFAPGSNEEPVNPPTNSTSESTSASVAVTTPSA